MKGDARNISYRALAMLLWTVVCTGSAWAQTEDAAPSVTLSCPNCTTWSQMQSVANNYFNQYKNVTPPGFPAGKKMRPCVWSWWSPIGEPVEYYYPNCSVAVVISTTYPLTGSFEFSRLDDGVVTTQGLHTPNDVSLREFDNYLTARSAKLPPINIPSTLNHTDPPELLTQYLQTQLTPTVPGQIDTEFWHGILNQGQFVRVRFNNAQTGQSYWIYVGDSITVQYANGYTEKFKFVSFASTAAWEKVEGSLRDQNGRKPSDPNPDTNESNASAVEYSTSGSGGDVFTFLAVPVEYNVPGSRIDRQGVVFITQIVQSPFGGDKLLLFME